MGNKVKLIASAAENMYVKCADSKGKTGYKKIVSVVVSEKNGSNYISAMNIYNDDYSIFLKTEDLQSGIIL